MSTPMIRKEAQGLLEDVESRMRAAEDRLAKGSDVEKIEAAGDLAFLRGQKQSLDQRLAAIDARPQTSETAYAWLKEEVFNLGLRLQDVLGRL